MSLPKVSCLMPTYNRWPGETKVLDEGVQSFLSQDYPNKELVLCNDTPGQELQFDHPQVIVRNLPIRCPTLGDKINTTAGFATGDLMMRWDDDDICLPWRLSWTVSRQLDSGYTKSSHFFYLTRNSLKYQPGIYGSCCFTREAFEKVGGFPQMGVGEDQGFEARMLSNGIGVRLLPVEPREAYYIYRWNGENTHVSGYGTGGYIKIAERPVVPGFYKIQPRWYRDYLQLAQRAVNSGGEYKWKNKG